MFTELNMNKIFRISLTITLMIMAIVVLMVSTVFAEYTPKTVSKLVADVDDSNPTSTGRIPLILIHGIHGTDDSFFESIDGSTANEKEYFKNFINYFYSSDLKDRYKLYRFHYLSDEISVKDIGQDLQEWLDDFIQEGKINDVPFVILAHSMGGLVARSYMQERKHAIGVYANQLSGERILNLITLATPYHGSPAANDDIRIPFLSDPLWNSTLEIIDIAVWWNDLSNLIISSSEPNRSDLRFDNYNFFWKSDVYTSPDEKNEWLIALNLKIPSYEDKIIAH